MTRKKDLKRRVRERQAKTGESYTAALAHIRKQPIEIEELPDATPAAKAAGLDCNAVVSKPELKEEALFVRVREMLEALGVPLQRLTPVPPAIKLAVEARRFLESVREGSRGVSKDGSLFALEWNGRVVVGGILGVPGRKPLLALALLDDIRGMPELSLMGFGR
jgi:hypothetical protein